MSTDADATAAPIRVLIVDDDTLVRAGLTMMLGGRPDLEIVGEAGDGIEALTQARATAPDVVLLDIRMPRRDGLSAAAELLAHGDGPRVIMLTTFDTDEAVLAALRLGAHGFLVKDTPPERIVDAIRQVAAGEPTLSPAVVRRLIAAATRDSDEEGRRRSARARLAALTPRELQVAVAVGAGRANADIARELFLSLATVKTHVTRIFEKLGATNRVQIAICVYDAEVAAGQRTPR